MHIYMQSLVYIVGIMSLKSFNYMAYLVSNENRLYIHIQQHRTGMTLDDKVYI